jgi:hypothetical protein
MRSRVGGVGVLLTASDAPCLSDLCHLPPARSSVHCASASFEVRQLPKCEQPRQANLPAGGELEVGRGGGGTSTPSKNVAFVCVMNFD